MTRTRTLTAAAAVATATLIGVVAAVSPAGAKYAPDIDASEFTTTIDNPFLPLKPGSRWVYRANTEEGVERIVVEVTRRTRQVMGVTTVVVHDVVSLDGSVIEDTFDWYAQDADGNVWYFGEDTKELDHGQVVSTEGSWEAGIDGAQPGIAMLARPRVGDRYRQEYYKGEAEDMAKVLRLDGQATVPYGRFDNLLVTKDWTPLDQSVIEHKYYSRGVGLVLELHVKGGDQRVELIQFSR